MTRKIAEGVGDVHVTSPKTGQNVILRAGDTVPKELDDLVGDHATETVRVKRQAPAGPGQTPATVAAGEAAQKAADAAGKTDAEKEAADKQAADDKAKADAEALEAAEKAEADKKAAAEKAAAEKAAAEKAAADEAAKTGGK